MNLYEIDEAIESCFDPETGEIFDSKKLEELSLAYDEKVENIACYVKNLDAEEEAIKVEKMRLAKRQVTTHNKKENLKRYLFSSLKGKKFTTGKVAISFRKGDKVEVDDVSSIPQEYLKFADPEPMKAEIKKALKAGAKIPGCRLAETSSIQIK